MKKLFNILLILVLSMGVFTSNKGVKAEESFTTKYAVQIYGIRQDTLDDGSTAGLTFGPALGQDFRNTYNSHTPSGVTTLGNPYRCVHDDEWETITRWNHEDPYVYEQCIRHNCTHSVNIVLSDTLRNPNFVYGGSTSGDGVGLLLYELINGSQNHLKWNGQRTNSEGWGASRIRAMLNGLDTDNSDGVITNITNATPDSPNTWADPICYTDNEALISAFPTILQDAIGARKTLYDSVYNNKTIANLKTTYDKLWLLSPNEMADSLSSEYNHPLEAPNGKYQKFIDNNLNLSTSYNDAFRACYQPGNTTTVSSFYNFSLRSSSSYSDASVTSVYSAGRVLSEIAYETRGVAPCFSLSSSYAPSYDPADPLYDPQADEGSYTTKRGINADNDWTKNGDTWIYTFDVFDDSIPYYIWEDKLEGYTSLVMRPEIALMNQNSEKYYEIINRSTTLGNLEISKIIDSDREINHKFDFTITLQGNDLEGVKTYSGIIFEDGVGHIKLGHNEKKLIEGLPAGTTYIVEEKTYSNYLTTSTGETGTIQSNTTSKAVFTNNPKTVESAQYGNLTLRKALTGNSQTDEKFNFTILFENLGQNTEYYIGLEDSFVSSDTGAAVVQLALGNNEEVTIASLPIGATYQVSEEAGEYISSYEITDTSNLGLINQSANENTTSQQALTTAVETIDKMEDITVEFRNHIIKKQNIKLQKEVIGIQEDKEKSFDITVELYDLEPNQSIETDAGKFVADVDGYAIKTIRLKNGEEFIIPELPVGTMYQITEEKNDCYASYEITDENNKDSIVKAKAENSTSNTKLSTQLETVDEDEEVTVKFINTSEVKLTLEKFVDGNMGNKTDEFDFTMKVWTEKDVFNGQRTPLSQLFEVRDTYYECTTGDEGSEVRVQIKKDFKYNGELYTVGAYSTTEGTVCATGEEVSMDTNNPAYKLNALIQKLSEYYAPAATFEDEIIVIDNVEYCLGADMGSPVYVASVFGEAVEDLTKYGAISNNDGTYKFTLSSGDITPEIKVPYGYKYEISEADYSSEGYRTYVGNSIIPGKQTSDTLLKDTNILFRNIRGAAVPTEIRFYWWAGSIPVLVAAIWFVYVNMRSAKDRPPFRREHTT